MIPTGFPRSARVRAGADFDRVFKRGRRVALPVLALHWQRFDASGDDAGRASGEAGARLGLAVSRKVDRRAVGRNRIKRALREVFRRHRSQLPAGDYVVVARRGATDCSTQDLQNALLGLLRRAGALLPPAAPVTMPAAQADAPVPRA